MDRILIEKAESIFKAFTEKKLTLSTAESCTGGFLSYVITKIPGASSFFKGGIVAYSNDVKVKILKVSPKTISKSGAVSHETALEMAKMATKLTSASFGLSVTGNLGPDALEEKECGLVYSAVWHNGNGRVERASLMRGREENRLSASLFAMEILLEEIRRLP